MPVPMSPENELRFAEMLRSADGFHQPHPMADHQDTRKNKYLDVYTAGELVILQDADGEWFNELINSGFDINWAMDSFYDAFYDHFEDEYQYLTVLLVADFGVFAAFYQPMANDTKGLGYDNSVGVDIFDTTTKTDIEGMIFMNYYGLWSGDRAVSRYVFGQEFMHRWGSFTQVQIDGQDPDVLLGRDTAHWSYWFDTANSPMEGNHWVDLGDGTWQIDSSISTYTPLDLYLMGLAPAEEVGTQTLLLVDQAEQDAVGKDPTSTPKYLDDLQTGRNRDLIVPAIPLTFELSAITAMEGERDPAYGDAPTAFHMPILVLVLSTDTVDDEKLAEIDALRQSWEADWEEDVLGRGDLITTLGTNDAPIWGDEGGDSGTADTASDDTGADSGDSGEQNDSGSSVSDDSGDTGTKDESSGGCGCDAAGSMPGLMSAAVVAAAAFGRRRKVQ